MTIKHFFPGGKTEHIMVADNCFSPEIAARLIEECKMGWDRLFSPGPTMGGVNPLIKCSMDFNFSSLMVSSVGLDTTVFAFAEREIAVGVSSAFNLYRDTYQNLWPWPDAEDTGYRLQVYARNVGFYRTHVDGEPWLVTASRPDRTRVLAAIIYLNEVADGGQTYFPAHGVEVDCVPGRVVLFPTSWTHPHGGKTPLSNDKWMISTFFTCPVETPQIPIPDKLDDELTQVVDTENDHGGARD